MLASSLSDSTSLVCCCDSYVRIVLKSQGQSFTMTPKANYLLLILILAIMEEFVILTLPDKEINFVPRQLNVTISAYGVNSVTLSWATENNEQIKNFTVRYQFSYRFLDRKHDITEETSENHATLKLRLHPGFIAKVREIHFDQNNRIVTESNWTEYIYNAPPEYICNVSCIIYNLTSLNCTWQIQKDAPKETQYSFSLRHRSDVFACQQYLTNQEKKNIGCHMKDVFSNAVKGGNLGRKIEIQFSSHEVHLFKTFVTANIEIFNPPINVSLSPVNEDIKIRWSPPLTVQSYSKNCFQYQIKLSETKKNPLIRVISSTEEEYLFADLDKHRRYSIQIRGRQKQCAKSKFWGEWSKPVFIGKDNEGIQAWLLLLIIMLCTFSIGVLTIYLWKRYTRKLFNSAIPDPSQKIKYWMSSNDINYQKCVAVVHNECVPITLIEIVTASQEDG
ncbi:interleukin-5 receptor subunit alpha-like [Ascaphus truei]|uniref:interleukin-5 receptor subunit alpha-like n=1 Tax=Ascaphus truei TaxID=8439 RepID=UPI003F59BB45